MRKIIANEKGYLSLISMLIALALLGYFVYIVINAYFNPITPSGQKGASSGPVSSNPGMVNPSIVDKTRSDIQKLNQRTLDQLKQVEGINK